eukprot:1043707-Rhodomonas_salina.2
MKTISCVIAKPSFSRTLNERGLISSHKLRSSSSPGTTSYSPLLSTTPRTWVQHRGCQRAVGEAGKEVCGSKGIDRAKNATRREKSAAEKVKTSADVGERRKRKGQSRRKRGRDD